MNGRTSLILMSIFYFAAGVNHFVHPAGYKEVIPPYLPDHALLNILAGAAEISLAALLLAPATRPAAAWLIIAMLVAFLTVHIYMIQMAPMKMGSLTVSPLIAWLRLPLQALLIAWACQFTGRT